MVDPIIWSNVEISVGIICACLPVLRPLVQAVGRRLFGGSSTALWHSSQFSQTADEIYGFEQSPKVQSPILARRAAEYLVMPEKTLPTLPPAADFRSYSQRAGRRGLEDGLWESRHSEEVMTVKTVRVKEHGGEGDDIVY